MARLDAVQAMRFLAAGLVVGTHSTLYAHDRMNSHVSVWHFGEIGVPLFFTISGLVMVVSTSSHRFERSYWRTFALRRLIRIGPMYWIATTWKLATMLLLPGTVLYAKLHVWNLVASYFFLPSHDGSDRIQPLLGVGWTLIFEMGFYALFTVGLAFGRHPLSFCAPVLCVLALTSGLVSAGSPAISYYCNTVVLYFLAGMAIGTYVVERRAPARLGAWIVLAAIVMAASYWRPGEGLPPAQPLVRFMAVVAVMTLTVSYGRILNGRIPALILLFGDASYSMYLFHPLLAPLVPTALHRVGVTSLAVSLPLTMALVLVASAALYRLAERPLTRRLSARLLPSAASPRLMPVAQPQSST